MLGGYDPFRNNTDFSTVGGNEQDKTQTAVVGLTALFSPRLVGEFHSSIARYRNNRIPPSNGLFDITSLGFPAALAAQAQFQTFPRFNFSTVASLGKLTSSEIRRVTDNYQRDRLARLDSWLSRDEIRRGIPHSATQRHPARRSDRQLQFQPGVHLSNPFASSSTSGNDVASFLLGLPSSGTMGQGLYLALERRYWAGFVQDRWKVTPHSYPQPRVSATKWRSRPPSGTITRAISISMPWRRSSSRPA